MKYSKVRELPDYDQLKTFYDKCPPPVQFGLISSFSVKYNLSWQNVFDTLEESVTPDGDGSTGLRSSTDRVSAGSVDDSSFDSGLADK